MQNVNNGGKRVQEGECLWELSVQFFFKPKTLSLSTKKSKIKYDTKKKERID